MATKKGQRSDTRLIIISGAVLLLLFLVIIVFIPCPTTAQFNIFRIIIPLAAGAFAAGIPGQFELKSKAVQATSAIGVFALVYLINPSGWVTKDDCRGVGNFRGIVFIDGKEQEGVEIIIPSINRSAFTDAYGNYNIEYSHNLVTYPLTVRFRYKTLLDSAIVYDELPAEKIELRFSIDQAVSTTVSISGNNASFSNKDFNVVISLTDNPYPNAGDFADSVRYTLASRRDTLAINPFGSYVNNFFNNKVVKALHIGADLQRLATPSPRLDLKILNNSTDAIFMTEGSIDVVRSTRDNRAFLIVGDGHTQIYLSNAGWGNANNVTLDYTVVPRKENNEWSENFEERIQLNDIFSDANNPEKSVAEVSFKNSLLRKGTQPEYFDETTRGAAEINEQIKRELTGPFYNGGFVFGRINFTEDDGTKRSVKFTASLDLWAEAGAAIDASAEYNSAFKAEGENYSINIPLSQGIKPKDFDRFFLTLHAPQSSFHLFRIRFVYNNNETFEVPVFFNLHYFNTPEGVKYATRVNRNRRAG